jgi:EAL domain-containing protein (putative c-di-GMP-specific phosphodiesterase class I)/GGDEF domain-containing protein
MFLTKISARLRMPAMTGIGLLGLCAGIGALGYLLLSMAAHELLEAEARIDTKRWSRHLIAGIADLPDIAQGSAPSAASQAMIDRSLADEHLVSFSVFDAKGFLKMRSGGAGSTVLAGSHLTATDPSLAPSMAAADVTTFSGVRNSGQTRFIASELSPIKSGETTVGWLLVNLDQTERQQLFARASAQASAVVCLLLFAAPLFGFWYRARHKARFERTLHDLSNRDQLTGFMLKSALLERIDQNRAIWENESKSALILCELAGAPAIAGTHGQHTEEQMVREAARRLAGVVAGRGTIAAAGHSTFIVFMEDVGDPMSALSLAKDVSLALSAESDIDGIRLSCRCICGIALTGADGRTGSQLIRGAELAVISLREQDGPDYGFFNPEQAKDSNRRLAVERAVSEAADEHRFHLDFQPVYNIRTGELNGFEALIRLHDTELGNVSPAEFVPIAEDMGLINQIGAWALDEACRVAAQWPAHLMVAVNLSPSQFMSGTLVADVRRALENHAYPSYRLEVEITEGTLLNDSEAVLRQLRILRDMGIAVALDDFGTGYSSMSYLWKFPFSKLKIDRSFVNALGESASAKGILRSIIKLGHGLGLTVTAEGIENSRQLSTLRDLGCDLAQGYLLDRPARIADLAAIILRNFANGLSRRAREQDPKKTAA